MREALDRKNTKEKGVHQDGPTPEKAHGSSTAGVVSRRLTARSSCSERRSPILKGLPDADVDAPPPRLLGPPPISRPGDRVELVADVGADRADRRRVADAEADVGAQVEDVVVPGASRSPGRPRRTARPRSAPRTGKRSSARGLEEAEPADDEAVAQRAHLVAAPAAQRRRSAEEVALEERHAALASGGCRRPRALTATTDAADRDVGAAVDRGLEVAPVTADERARLLEVQRQRSSRAARRAGCRRCRGSRRGRAATSVPSPAPALGIETERDQVVAEGRIQQRRRLDGEPLVLVDEGDRRRAWSTAAGRTDRAAPARGVTLPRPPRVSSVVGRLVRVPLLHLDVGPVAGRKEIRDAEVGADAAIERRPLALDACRCGRRRGS